MVSPHSDVVEKEPVGKSRSCKREGASEGVGSWASGGGSWEGLGPEPEAGKGYPFAVGRREPSGSGFAAGGGLDVAARHGRQGGPLGHIGGSGFEAGELEV